MKIKILRLIKMVSKFTIYGILIQTISLSVLLASNGNAQNKSVKEVYIEVEQSYGSLDDVFNMIEAQTNYRFAYSKDNISNSKDFEIKGGERNLYDVLIEVSQKRKLKFTQINNSISVEKIRQKDISDFGVVEIEQAITVTGKVTSADDGEGLPGVNVIVKGSGQGTVTDVEGNYGLDVPSEGSILVFSSVGFISQEIAVGTQSAININLAADVTALDEIVVVGYGTQKKVSLTGSVASVSSEDIESIPTSNLSNTLAGRAPGVTIVQTSGFVGSSSNISIRGNGSLNATSPLYVIDQIVSSKAEFDVLDPNEVESVSFLKDAATAAIYGARSANGVVLVTTKKGKIGKPVFNYKGFFTMAQPTKPIQSYTATEQLEYRNDNAETFGNPLPISQEIFDYFKDKNYELNDYIWRDPSSQQHNLSVNGGSEAIDYYMMIGGNQSKGSYTNTDYSRLNFRSNVTAKVTKNLKVNLNLSGSKRSTNRFYWPYDWDNGEGFELSDFYRTTFNWSRLYPYFVDEQGNPSSDMEDGLPVNSGGWNPVLMLQNGNYRNIEYNNFRGVFRVDWDIPGVKGLTTSFLGNYSFETRNQKNFVIHNKAYTFQSASATNPYVPGPVDPTQISVHNLSRAYEGIDESAQFNNSYQFDWFLNYDNIFGKHSVSGMVVYEQSESNGKSFNGSANELLTTSVDQIFATSTDSDRRYFNGGESEWGRASWIGRAHYEYDDRYIAEFSFRYDGSYKFAKDNRWGFFPSFSGAWRISEEDFYSIDAMSSLKLRASYGSSGDDGGRDQIAPFQFQNNYSPGSGYVFGNSMYNGIRAGTPPNPDITWEKLSSYNFGLDVGFMDDKLIGGFDFFKNHRYDILWGRERVVPGTYGASLSNENYAEVDVKGFELDLRYRDRAGDLSYSIGANMGYAKDKVILVDEPAGLEDWRSAIGHPQNRLWGYVSQGIIRDQATLDAIPSDFTQFGRDPMLGVILFEDIRGANRTEGADGIVDDNDQTWLSDNAVPRINYGISFNLAWKGLVVDMLFQGVGAYDKIVKTQNTSTGGVFQTGDRPYFELWTDRWTPERPDAPYPRAGNWGMNEFGWAPSQFWIRSGAYLRFKNLNIAYDLPISWLEQKNMKIQVFVNGTNLFVASKFKEYDPEQDRLDSYPLMKSYTGGLNIKF